MSLPFRLNFCPTDPLFGRSWASYIGVVYLLLLYMTASHCHYYKEAVSACTGHVPRNSRGQCESPSCKQKGRSSRDITAQIWPLSNDVTTIPPHYLIFPITLYSVADDSLGSCHSAISTVSNGRVCWVGCFFFSFGRLEASLLINFFGVFLFFSKRLIKHMGVLISRWHFFFTIYPIFVI